jgi:glycosyltransferase involved in cell wall biosynthesis
MLSSGKKDIPTKLPTCSAAASMRVAFVVENQLGHRALLANLQAALALQSTVDPIWLPLDSRGESLLERIPQLRDKHALIFGLKVRKLLRDAEANGKFEACFMHTQRMAHLAVDRMKQLPTFLSIDATPVELDTYRGLNGLPSERGSFYWRLRDAIHRRTYAAARGIVTMSRSVASSLVSHYQVNPTDVLVLWPGVDTEKWKPPLIRAPGEEFRILFVGADFDRKGGNFLLRWAKETMRRDFRVDVVTEQPIKQTPRVTIHTKFAPNQPGLVELAKEADLFVLPTRADMSPWAICEAKAAGTAIISTHVGGIPELVRDGVDGWLVRPNDYTAFAELLEGVLSNRRSLADFGSRAREDALERFNAVTNAHKLVEFMRTRV